MIKNKIKTQTTIDCYPNLTPLQREQLRIFENLNYFESPFYLQELKQLENEIKKETDKK